MKPLEIVLSLLMGCATIALGVACLALALFLFESPRLMGAVIGLACLFCVLGLGIASRAVLEDLRR